MKKILFTQRVEVIESYGERRDSIDQRISEFLVHCGFLPVAVPNIPELANDYLNIEDVCGVFLTGGNSLEKYGGDAPERDETERLLVENAIKRGLPVFGICRGMQFILDYFGVKLEAVDNHVRKNHPVNGVMVRDSVNSYHTMAGREAVSHIVVLGKAPDGFIEAIRHDNLPIMAIMWHPERENPFDENDVELVRGFFS